MKTKIIMAFTAGLLTTFQLKAQNRLYLGFELAKIKDQFILTDPTSNIGAPNPFRDYVPSASLILGYEINPWLSFETGLTSKPTKQGYNVAYSSGGVGSSSAYSPDVNLQVPIRLKSNINIYKSFYLNAAVGYHFGFTNNAIQFDERQGGSGWVSSSSGFEASHSQTIQVINNRYGLIETGIGITYQLNDRISFNFKATSYHGTDVIDKVNVQYEDNQGYSSNNSIMNKGSYNSFGLGMNYRFKSFSNSEGK